MTESIPSNRSLASTAHWTAAARSKENEREDGLFHDSWAAELAGDEGALWLERLSGSVFGTTPMVIRTRYFDDFLKDAARVHGLRQVVILAAGLDTRAYRLEWPAGTCLFELDQLAVLQYKEQVLSLTGAKPACQRFAIGVDLTTAWDAALIASGFDPNQPAAWLLEGFLFYLSKEHIQSILEKVGRLSAPASRLGFDIINQQTLNSPLTKAWIDMQARQGAPWIGWLDDPVDFLAESGWQASITQPGALDANYGRWLLPVIPLDAPNLPHTWYVKAVKSKPGTGA